MIGVRRGVEICEEVLGAQDGRITIEKNPIFVFISVGFRLVILAITEAGIVGIGRIDGCSRRFLQVASR
jgi:hypothetical protein